MNLEDVTRKLEQLQVEQKNELDRYDRQIAELVAKKNERYKMYQIEIDSAKEVQKLLLGDADEIETDSFVVYKKAPNMKSQTTYKLNIPKAKKERTRFDEYMRQEHPELINEEVIVKPIQKEIKKRIIDGSYHITDEGLLVDENGVAMPNTTVDIKGVEVKVKVKEA